jgi:flagellin
MPLYINTNSSSINSRNKLNKSTSAMQRSFERLSSGLRINSARDDAAGLAISNRMTAQINGLYQSIRNSSDGLSLSETAEGALSETTNLLQRMRELAVQAASDQNNPSDRQSIQQEVDQLINEIDRIAESTTFNNNKLLNGDVLQFNLQIGANVGEDLKIRIGEMDSKSLARQMRRDSLFGVLADVGISQADGLTLAIEGFTVRDSDAIDDQLSTSLNENSALAKAAAINDLYEFTGVRAIVGPAVVDDFNTDVVGGGTLDEQNHIIINGAKIAGFQVLENDADNALTDAINAEFDQTGVLASRDAAGELKLTAEDGRNIEIEFAEGDLDSGFITGLLDGVFGGQLTLQAEKQVDIDMSDADMNQALGDILLLDGDPPPDFNKTLVFGTNSDHSVNEVDLTTRLSATEALDIIDLGLEQISSQRSRLGALQNRLESTIQNLETTAENLSASRSRITDADFASETAQLSRNQIIQNAGVSILSQANQLNTLALNLLQ